MGDSINRRSEHVGPSAVSSLFNANPAAGETVKGKNTTPLHDPDNPLSDLDSTSITGERDREIAGARTDAAEAPEKDSVRSMIYDPIDQDNTTNDR